MAVCRHTSAGTAALETIGSALGRATGTFVDPLFEDMADEMLDEIRRVQCLTSLIKWAVQSAEEALHF